jgi:hypothetical protein
VLIQTEPLTQSVQYGRAVVSGAAAKDGKPASDSIRMAGAAKAFARMSVGFGYQVAVTSKPTYNNNFLLTVRFPF